MRLERGDLVGCDIHTRVEYYTTINGEKKWIDGDHYKRNKYFGDNEDEVELNVVSIYDDRNYTLFSILAGVRGCEDMINEPRGLPFDTNKFIKGEFERWGASIHTASWFTLKELMDYQDTLLEASLDRDVRLEECEDETKALIPLIENLKIRCKELFWLWDEYRIAEFAHKIRVVFWFDN